MSDAAGPLPPGFRLDLDVTAKRLRDDLFFGGTPARIMRLTESGRAAWQELRDHGVVDRRTGMLARRLTDAGIAHPVPPRGSMPDVTVVVPVHGRADDLDRCLAALGQPCPVVVVDDGSPDPEPIAKVCAAHGSTLLQRAENGGPGAARNTGSAYAATEFVAFVDSDCTPPRGWLEPLLAHLADPQVAAVAPRITPRTDDTWSGRYTRLRSSLDLGGLPARVMPGTRVAYVPTAAVVVRRSAVLGLDQVFDESLRVGEDVDLVWRLHAAGWRIRYDPSVQVPHREPQTWPAVLSRRFRYGTSAGPLAQRHPGALTPLVLQPWPAAAVAALVARRPLLAAAAGTAAGAATVRTLHGAGVPTAGSVSATARAIQQTFLGVGRYATQFAAPALLAGLAARRTRFATAALLVGPPLSAWAAHRRLDPVRYCLGAVADDVAYGTGVWAGGIRARTFRPLCPAVVRRPVRVDPGRS